MPALKVSKTLVSVSVALTLQSWAGSFELPFFGQIHQLALAGDDEVTPPSMCVDTTPPSACLGVRDGVVVEAVGYPAVVTIYAGGLAEETSTADTASPMPGSDRLLNPLGLSLTALDAAMLDEVRGGFDIAGSNLQFSFGIERAIYVNGSLVAATVLNIKNLLPVAGAGDASLQASSLQASSPQASLPQASLPQASLPQASLPQASSPQASLPQASSPAPSTTTSALSVIQNGSGNNVVHEGNPILGGTIIQNTLNNQNIQAITTINANVNSMQILRAMSMLSAIQDGILNSLRH
ncbi:MAG TPA: hypothetical protein VFW68_10990 [Rhodocyclaceae bacterium]|nr:hypothetical protein [Rhodocyclaceae bacterium]